MSLPTPGLRHVCDLFVALDPIREMGMGRAGQRRIIPIVGGRVEGPELRGRILNLGADWQTIFSDGSADIDTRYAFETDDGAIIEIINKGVRHGPENVIAAIARGEEVDPKLYYFRTTARLETGDQRYDWVNRTIFIGSGARDANKVRVALYTVE